MADFPTLRTGAVMQYPAACSVQFRNQVLKFVDGSEQRYRDGHGPLRQWEVRLDLLDESELAALDNFFESLEGSFGTFSFVDPRDGAAYPKCSFAQDLCSIQMNAEARGAISLTIREEKS